MRGLRARSCGVGRGGAPAMASRTVQSGRGSGLRKGALAAAAPGAHFRPHSPHLSRKSPMRGEREAQGSVCTRQT